MLELSPEKIVPRYVNSAILKSASLIFKCACHFEKPLCRNCGGREGSRNAFSTLKVIAECTDSGLGFDF